MRKSLMGILAVLAMVAMGALAAKASETELTLVSGAATYDSTPSSSSSLTYSNTNFNGWSITVTTGETNSPDSLPYGINLTSVAVTCSKASCEGAPLTITFGGTDFTQVSSSFDVGYTLTSASGSTASTTLTGWYDPSDALLAENLGNWQPTYIQRPSPRRLKGHLWRRACWSDPVLTYACRYVQCRPGRCNFCCCKWHFSGHARAADDVAFRYGLVGVRRNSPAATARVIDAICRQRGAAFGRFSKRKRSL